MVDLGHKRGLFPSTRWTLVQRAQGSQGKKAFGELLTTYWRPLFVLARLRGLPPDQASDMVQSFMVHLLDRQVFVEKLDPSRGRLRSYLKTAFRHFLDNQKEREHSHKRGGQHQVVNFELEHAEHCVDTCATDPDAAYEREWALTVFENALGSLEQEHSSGLRSGPFELIRRYFSGDLAEGYRTLATEYEMSVPQLKSFLHRARQRYRQLLQEALADTLDISPPLNERTLKSGEPSSSPLVEEELARLQAALSR